MYYTFVINQYRSKSQRRSADRGEGSSKTRRVLRNGKDCQCATHTPTKCPEPAAHGPPPRSPTDNMPHACGIRTREGRFERLELASTTAHSFTSQWQFPTDVCIFLHNKGEVMRLGGKILAGIGAWVWPAANPPFLNAVARQNGVVFS